MPRAQVLAAAGSMLLLPLQNGVAGDFGVTSMTIGAPKLTPFEIKRWLLHDLVEILNPYPNPR